jgi:LEA14-like dessication related protein
VARGVVVFTTIITHVVSVIPSGHGYSTITVKVYVLTEVEINHILVILNEFSFIFTIRVQNPGTTTSPEQ